MKLSEEDTNRVLVADLPEQSEYSQIIYDAQDAGKLISSDFEGSQKCSQKAWHSITELMAACIARGMRLRGERNTAV